ncbi:MAG: sigma-70 family RNA polymerase sigma factor [candidate division WOR-3 bacterium]|nr:sigma-70 family RNA polymerase sigma factor [candidate division WOR-3 bacterium]MCR4423878.1 sigma-70 family RNA polymerase sigma factor [candidate division WOR-3 bacterium]MDH7519216.1 sigma-70 family RNA polymerase sigma factor [bacterium]
MATGKTLQVAAPGLPVGDDELVRRAQRGNTEAFEELVRRYESRVYNITYRLLGNEEDAAEALQDTFIRAYRAISRFKFKSSFYTWLYRIATNVSLTKLRRRKTQDTISLDEPIKDTDDLQFDIPDSQYTPEQVFEQKRLREKLQEAIDRLPAEYRTVVVMRDLQGLSNEEVSKTLGLSVPAVKSRLHRGRMALREQLARYL